MTSRVTTSHAASQAAVEEQTRRAEEQTQRAEEQRQRAEQAESRANEVSGSGATPSPPAVAVASPDTAEVEALRARVATLEAELKRRPTTAVAPGAPPVVLAPDAVDRSAPATAGPDDALLLAVAAPTPAAIKGKKRIEALAAKLSVASAALASTQVAKKAKKKEIQAWMTTFEETQGHPPSDEEKLPIKPLFIEYKQLEVDHNVSHEIDHEIDRVFFQRAWGGGHGKHDLISCAVARRNNRRALVHGSWASLRRRVMFASRLSTGGLVACAGCDRARQGGNWAR